MSSEARAEAKHVEDVESCVYSNGRLYTGSDDGFIKVRAEQCPASMVSSPSLPHLLY